MLIGLGLGPGDRELLTLKAVRLLGDAGRVFVPGRMAQELVAPFCAAEVLDFPMTPDEEKIRRCMEENARKIAPFATGSIAVLGMIGDPNFYSTFSRLCAVMKEMYPGIEYQTVPGVSSITAFAAVAGTPVSGGFVVCDGDGEPSSRIMLKVRKPGRLVERLKGEGYREFVLVERAFMEGESVYRGDDIPEESDYFSIMYARR